MVSSGGGGGVILGGERMWDVFMNANVFEGGATGRRDFLGRATVLAAVCGVWGMSPGDAAGAEVAAQRRTAQDKVLAELEAEDESMFRVPGEERALVYWLARLRGAREVLEIGTAHGYLTYELALAAQARGGRVTTIEIVPERRAKAVRHLERLGVAGRVTSLEGDAHVLVAGLRRRFDFVFLNADKSGNLDYWRKLYPGKVRAGGVVLAYNYSRRLEPMMDFVEAARGNPQVATAVFSALPDDVFFGVLDLR